MSIYTRKGDKGKTKLITGESVDKDDACIHCYGLLDELSSYIGWLLSSFNDDAERVLTNEKAALIHAQEVMLNAPLAFLKPTLKADGCGTSAKPLLPTEADVEVLERLIDGMNDEVRGLFKGFVLPGGQPLAAQSHVVRCVCRRIERHLYTLVKTSDEVKKALNQAYLLPYVNRLSDFLYALAIKINYCAENK